MTSASTGISSQNYTSCLVDDRSKLGKELRAVLVDTLVDLMKSNERILAFDADLCSASNFSVIDKVDHEQFVQCGISEANMVGVAAGTSSEGFIPFVHTFAPFASRRVFDQVYLSGAYAKNTFNIYGSDPGFCVGPNGGTHTSFEDVALMRSIPGAVVCDAADAVQMEWLVRSFAGLDQGVHYLRANRKAVRELYKPGTQFELGKGCVVREGTDVLLVSAGQLVSDALDAAQILQEQGISAELIDMFCIKPLDRDLLVQEARGKQAVVTFENHSIIGGLGSAVAEALMEAGVSCKFKRHGVTDRFGQVGTPDFLQEEFKLCAKDLVQTITELV